MMDWSWLNDIPNAIKKPTPRKDCIRCGKPKPQAHWRHVDYCSRSCFASGQADRTRFPRKPCVVCGKTNENIAGPTCSKACGYEFRKRKTRRPKTCPMCRQSFYPVRRRGGVWSKYCSGKCAKKKAGERLAMVEVTCEHCARIFKRTKGAVKRVKHIFCNKVCLHKFMRGENSPGWRGGHDPNRGPAWLALAAKIRDRDMHICTRCGRTEKENGQKLDVDHIQPWRALIQFGIEVANDPANLTSLCRKCHRWKTAHVDTAWLKRGDCLTMSEYQRQVKLPPLFQQMD